MSLVEKALKKLQDSRTSSPARHSDEPEEIVVGSLVSTASLPRPDFSALNIPKSDKIIVVDRTALRQAGLMPSEQRERLLAQEYRQIKRPLIAAARGKGVARKPNGHLIMLASALPGEGKTFTSINLALSMALEKDIRILLVDADVAKPHISRTFGVDKEPGLLDVLRDESLDVESVVIPTDIPGLSILPAGKAIETATELLASGRMQQMAEALGNRSPNRIVLFDSPPLLLTSESRALAGVVGQIVIVVRAGFTRQQAVLEAIDSLGESVDPSSIALILNQCEAASPGLYYGYGEYYGDPSTKSGAGRT